MLKSIIRVGTILILLANLLCQSACGFGPSIHYVLPNGYIGVFYIVEDEGGTDIKESDGRYVYEIPGDGILRVRSFKPFRDLREVAASYSDGTKIPGMFDEGVGRDTIALRYLGSHSVGDAPITIVMLVGTETQADDANKEIYSGAGFFKTPPGEFNKRLLPNK